ncbi:polysaccharide deacetylase family protein [Thermospira aquatica]|uniref:Uncharacterized protein n=1 Tax=Thermospira aquatica TaxID=2828656 RepID=A0AAX3BF09_9SPIR|nr:hypothetical protein [Thermospira aquatica]URA10713.1 hypothetical protein KDW03_02605 [Thermospira aquatica]
MKRIALVFMVTSLVVLGFADLSRKPQTNITGLLIVLGNEPFTSFGIKVDETNTVIIHPLFQNKVKKLSQETYEWKGYMYTGQELIDGSTSASLKKANALVLSNQTYFFPMKWKKIKRK